MAGSVIEVEWEGRVVDAFVPEPLADVGDLGAEAARAAAFAEGVLTGAAAHVGAGLEVPARLLLRAEGVASSRIEAISAPAELVAVADVDRSVGGPAAWVADNLRAVDAALSHEGRLTTATIRAWHRVLMANAELDRHHIGAWRDRLGWVGGPTPHRAAHVAAPHARVPELMDDLVSYANGRRHDSVTQAALVHAQFETIHPFADGNGRLGRLLIAWVLRRRMGLTMPPPVSVAFLRDVGGYLSGLTLFRTAGPDPWVRWFAGAIEGAAASAATALAAVAELAADWPTRLGAVRSDAAARRLVEQLTSHPALDAETTAALLGISTRAARTALETLEATGILRPVGLPTSTGPGRPRRWWVAGELLDLLTR